MRVGRRVQSRSAIRRAMSTSLTRCRPCTLDSGNHSARSVEPSISLRSRPPVIRRAVDDAEGVQRLGGVGGEATARRDDAGVDAEQLADGGTVAGLFAHLAPCRVLRVFAGLEPAARQSPRRAATFVPVREQDAVVGVDDDRVRRDPHVHAFDSTDAPRCVLGQGSIHQPNRRFAASRHPKTQKAPTLRAGAFCICGA